MQLNRAENSVRLGLRDYRDKATIAADDVKVGIERQEEAQRRHTRTLLGQGWIVAICRSTHVDLDDHNVIGVLPVVYPT